MSIINNPVQRLMLTVSLSALVMSGLCSCHKNTFATLNQQVKDKGEKSAKIVQAGNAFGFDLFSKTRNLSKSENLLISPLSVSAALAMIYNGAGKDTKAEMENVMRLSGLTKEQINSAYNKLISDLNTADKKVVFEIANAIYYARGYKVHPGFIALNQEVYEAEVSPLDFSSPEAVNTINSWVNKKTQGKIENIIQELKPLDRMVLLNAIYFYGTWGKAFDTNGTKNRDFIKMDGTIIRVPMMNKLDTLPYFSAESFKAIKIPYGTGQYSMVILLPHNGNNIGDVVSKLSAEMWNAWMNSFKLTERVDVTMPRFKFTFEIALKDVLSEMGMQQAFMPNSADFSGISEEELYISDAKHKTYIDVNETGTEAAAVTSVGFAATSFRDEPPTVPFYVDRPFIFAVTETKTGALLFLGEVKNPEY